MRQAALIVHLRGKVSKPSVLSKHTYGSSIYMNDFGFRVHKV